MEYLISKGAKVNTKLPTYRRPLLWACKYEQYAHIVKQLLEQGAKADVEDYEERSALLLACKYSTRESVRLLLLHGAYAGNTTTNFAELTVISPEGALRAVSLRQFSSCALFYCFNKLNIHVPCDVVEVLWEWIEDDIRRDAWYNSCTKYYKYS